jgi:diacylglycerol kinase family enzyme
MTLPEALHAIARAPVRSVDIATANGRAFVHQYSVGLHARLVRIRETLAYKGRYGKILASTRAFLSAMVNPPRFLAEVRTAKGVDSRYYSAIQVTNNPLGEGHLPHADTLEHGRLGFYSAPPLSMRDTAQLIIDVMRGTWRSNPFVFEREAREVTLTFPRRKSSAMATIDGELVPLPERVEIRLHPGALKVVAPAANRIAAG